MSERGKRVFRFLLDPERDADVIGRMEAQPSMTGYVRELVRRDIHDERLDFAALKASELQAENAKLRELAKQMHICLTRPKVYDGEQPYLTATECPYFTEGACDYNACGFEQRMQELDIEVDR